jgi:hypothetical protein
MTMARKAIGRKFEGLPPAKAKQINRSPGEQGSASGADTILPGAGKKTTSLLASSVDDISPELKLAICKQSVGCGQGLAHQEEVDRVDRANRQLQDPEGVFEQRASKDARAALSDEMIRQDTLDCDIASDNSSESDSGESTDDLEDGNNDQRGVVDCCVFFSWSTCTSSLACWHSSRLIQQLLLLLLLLLLSLVLLAVEKCKKICFVLFNEGRCADLVVSVIHVDLIGLRRWPWQGKGVRKCFCGCAQGHFTNLCGCGAELLACGQRRRTLEMSQTGSPTLGTARARSIIPSLVSGR